MIGYGRGSGRGIGSIVAWLDVQPLRLIPVLMRQTQSGCQSDERRALPVQRLLKSSVSHLHRSTFTSHDFFNFAEV